MRHLITGGGGFLGSALCNKLALLGHNVVAIDNFSRSSHIREKLHSNVECYERDIRCVFSIDDVIRKSGSNKFDILWHLAYINGTENFYSMPNKVLDVAVNGALNTIRLAQDDCISKYILISTSEVYNEPRIIPTPETEPLIIPDAHNPRFSYSGGKIISELLAIHSGLDTVIFRPHNVYGKNAGFEHVIPQLIKKMLDSKDGTIEIQGDGSETRSFCYVDDCIDGMILGSQSQDKNAIFNIGTMDEISIIELAHKIAKVLKIDIKINTTPRTNGSPLRRCPDITKLKSLGYKPKVSLEDGLKQTVEWYKSRLEA